MLTEGRRELIQFVGRGGAGIIGYVVERGIDPRTCPNGAGLCRNVPKVFYEPRTAMGMREGRECRHVYCYCFVFVVVAPAGGAVVVRCWCFFDEVVVGMLLLFLMKY